MNNTNLHNVERIERIEILHSDPNPFFVTTFTFYDNAGNCHAVAAFSDQRLKIEEVKLQEVQS